jgi:hypothetical protein
LFLTGGNRDRGEKSVTPIPTGGDDNSQGDRRSDGEKKHNFLTSITPVYLMFDFAAGFRIKGCLESAPVLLAGDLALSSLDTKLGISNFLIQIVWRFFSLAAIEVAG